MSGGFTLRGAPYPDAPGQWYYEPGAYLPHRYILGTVGQRPLVCVGINPSTAQPSALDNTLKSVARIAKNNGYDSWMVFNVYPQRATNPNDMHGVPNEEWHRQNMAWFSTVLKEKPGAALWAAWGTLIEKRPYLRRYMGEMVAISQAYGAPWVCFGRLSKAGHPHHPLYLAQAAPPQPFDAAAYAKIHCPNE